MNELGGELVRVLVPATISFALGMALTPVLTHYLYKYKAWKKRPGKQALDGSVAEEFNRLHTGNEVRAPRMGGIVVWAHPGGEGRRERVERFVAAGLDGLEVRARRSRSLASLSLRSLIRPKRSNDSTSSAATRLGSRLRHFS